VSTRIRREIAAAAFSGVAAAGIAVDAPAG